MKLNFRILAILAALISVFINVSVALGIILGVVGLELINLSHKKMETTIMNATEVSSRIIFVHFFIVILIMIGTLGLAFVYQDIFNPYALAFTFVADRGYRFISNAFKTGEKEHE